MIVPPPEGRINHVPIHKEDAICHYDPETATPVYIPRWWSVEMSLASRDGWIGRLENMWSDHNWYIFSSRPVQR